MPPRCGSVRCYGSATPTTAVKHARALSACKLPSTCMAAPALAVAAHQWPRPVAGAGNYDQQRRSTDSGCAADYRGCGSPKVRVAVVGKLSEPSYLLGRTDGRTDLLGRASEREFRATTLD